MGKPIETPPAFDRVAPRPPDVAVPRGTRAEWRRVIPTLERLDLIKPQDRAMLVAYCETWALFEKSTRIVARDGPDVVNRVTRKDGSVSESKAKHPAVNVMIAAEAELRRYSELFGLNPVAERNVAAVPVPDEDVVNPFAAGFPGRGEGA